MKLFSFVAWLGVFARTFLSCQDTLPQNGDSAVYIEFFTNNQGGPEGSDCPVACDSPIHGNWYPINTETCITWPGASGENAMLGMTPYIYIYIYIIFLDRVREKEKERYFNV